MKATNHSARTGHPDCIPNAGEMTRGAEAFLDMMRKIERVRIVHQEPDPNIDQDDGKRWDYAAADEIVLRHVRDAFGITKLPDAARGFLQAWVTALLLQRTGTICVEAWTGAELLTDCGQRALQGDRHV